MTNDDYGRVIKVRRETYEELAGLKIHANQPFDEVVRGLIAFWRSKRNQEPVVLEEVTP